MCLKSSQQYLGINCLYMGHAVKNYINLQHDLWSTIYRVVLLLVNFISFIYDHMDGSRLSLRSIHFLPLGVAYISVGKIEINRDF